MLHDIWVIVIHETYDYCNLNSKQSFDVTGKLVIWNNVSKKYEGLVFQIQFNYSGPIPTQVFNANNEGWTMVYEIGTIDGNGDFGKLLYPGQQHDLLRTRTYLLIHYPSLR